MNISIQEATKILKNSNITILKLRDHSKASEKYVDVKLTQSDGYIWEGSIPYSYRRTGLCIESAQELADYLNEIYPLFTNVNIAGFVETETKRWQKDGEFGGKKITKGFFDILLNLNWNSIQYDLPANPNWARRVQEIKEFGYTLATNTSRQVKGKDEKGTHILLVPIPKGGATGYEVMSPVFKAKAISVLNSVNIYELSSANKHGLIPDHKFPEIRWDEATRAENPGIMKDDEIKQKFQLLDNQRNQQKREICRKCFQTGKRGIIYGVNFFYEGDENWADHIPKTGKDAEKGCVGCGWYDVQMWRDSLNALAAKK